MVLDSYGSATPNLSPILFGDQWPHMPRCPGEPEFETPGLTEVKKWRLQTLLALARWGIPSLAFADAYEKTFDRHLDLKDMGFSSLSDMISNLPDVFAVQEPDELTALIFPCHPDDRILHDARLRSSFQKTYQERVGSAYLSVVPSPEDDASLALSGLPSPTLGFANNSTDIEDLILRAYYNRDYEFPRDVVLPGEQYSDFILPKMVAAVPNTRGVYQAVIVGAANPNGFYINVRNDSLDRIDSLAKDVQAYFAECGDPVEMYSIPEEFIYSGFPCLVYKQLEQVWERGMIVGPGKKPNKVFVETVDYGGIVSVDKIFIYLMPRKFLDIPKQALYVSTMGIRPIDEESNDWSIDSGARVRSFSHSDYWLDLLLVDPMLEERESNASSESDPSEISLVSSQHSSDYIRGKYLRRGRKWHKDPQFEALVVDRHDDELSLFLDVVLTMELYALYDDSRIDEIEALREQFNHVLETLPRPSNPMTKPKTVPIPELATPQAPIEEEQAQSIAPGIDGN